MAGVTAEDFKAAMASFAAGVTVVTTIDAKGAPHALTATAFSSLSKTPPLCLVCVDRSARAHPVMLASRRFAINILSADQSALSEQCGKRNVDKFANVAWGLGRATGCPIIARALSSVECELVDVHAGGDHDIFVGRILDTIVNGGDPLVYFRGAYAMLSSPVRKHETSRSAATRPSLGRVLSRSVSEEPALFNCSALLSAPICITPFARSPAPDVSPSNYGETGK
jgi:flavin reductase (DIM6/NTAB) family NADH-FMN oxidoreductase RutF